MTSPISVERSFWLLGECWNTKMVSSAKYDKALRLWRGQPNTEKQTDLSENRETEYDLGSIMEKIHI